MFFAPVKSRQGTKIWNMSVSKTTDCIQIKIKMSNLCNPHLQPNQPKLTPGLDYSLSELDPLQQVQERKQQVGRKQ